MQPTGPRSRAVPVLIGALIALLCAAAAVVFYFHTQATERKQALEAAVQAVAITTTGTNMKGVNFTLSRDG